MLIHIMYFRPVSNGKKIIDITNYDGQNGWYLIPIPTPPPKSDSEHGPPAADDNLDAARRFCASGAHHDHCGHAAAEAGHAGEDQSPDAVKSGCRSRSTSTSTSAAQHQPGRSDEDQGMGLINNFNLIKLN